MLVLRTSNFQEETIRLIVPRHKHTPLPLFFTTTFSSARQFKNHIEFLNFFLMKAVKFKCKI